MITNKDYILLNNTQLYNHLGCFYTSIGLKKNLSELGYNCVLEIDVNNTSLSNIEDYLKMNRKLNIIINGEGTFHDDQEYAIYLINFVSQMPDRVMLLNSQLRHMSQKYVNILKNFKFIQVRTKYDYNWCSAAGITGHSYCPDMFFYSGLQRIPTINKNTIFTDSHDQREATKLYNLFTKTDDAIWSNFHFLPPHNKQRKVEKSLRKVLSHTGLYKRWKYINWANRVAIHELITTFSASKTVVTGRYHAACLAIMYEKPFFYANSNTSKIKDLSSDFAAGMPIEKFGSPNGEEYSNSTPVYDKEKMDIYKKRFIDKLSQL